jgi:hypothetical protein
MMNLGLVIDTAIAFLKRWQSLLPWAIVLALLLRLYGFLWFDGVIEQRDRARVQFADCQRAGIKAREAQIALNNQTKAKYEAAAKEADHEHEKALALANDRTERWIAANRVRQTGGSRPGGASPAAEGEATERGDGPGEGTDLVAVSADDVRICTANTLRLKAVNEWGKALVESGVAE